MSPVEGRPPKRMLPSVTDVVNELSRVVKEDPAVLFKVARQVVAEELGRVKQGFESASIEVLARRARRLLGPVSGEGPAVVQASLFTAPEPGPGPAPLPRPGPARPPVPEPVAPAGSRPEEPFAASSEGDLGWEKDLPIQPDDAPFRSAILPIPRSRMPAGISPPPDEHVPTRRAEQAWEVAALPPPPAVAPEVPEILESAEPEEGEEVEEVEEVEEAEQALPPPQPAVAPEPPPKRPASSPSAPAAPAASAAPPPPKPDVEKFLQVPAPAVPSAPPPVRSEGPASLPPPLVRPVREPPPAEERQQDRPRADSGPEIPEQGRITTQEWKSLGVPTERLPAPAPEVEAEPGRPRKPVPPEERKSRGWLIALAAVLVAASGAAYFLKDLLSGRPLARVNESVAARLASPKPSPTAAPALPTPAPDLAAKPPGQKAAATNPSVPPAATPAPPRPAASASGRTKGALIVSKDWAGRPAVWVIHFSSHKDRPGAEREAARLGAALGKSGHAIQVDLGEKGIWYRVLIGDFATQDEARAYHDELQAKNTPNLGFVYQLMGEE